MDGYLKQSTAVTVKIGPFLSTADADAEMTGLTINAADVLLSKNGSALTLKTEATACTHDAAAYYDCDLDATDTATPGRLLITVHVATALAVRHTYCVLPANVYDSYVAGSDYLQVDAVQVGGATPETAADTADAVLDDDATARTTANSIGKAINVLTALAARVNNAELNALLGVADSAAKTLINSIVSDGTALNTTGGVLDTVTIIGGLSTAALQQFINVDTGLTTAVDGSVAKNSQGGSGGSSAAEVWTFSPRTLTMTGDQIEAITQGSLLTLHRGDTLSLQITGLGDLSACSKLWFTVKGASNVIPDSQSVIQVLLVVTGTASDGLLYIAQGAPESAANGSIVINTGTTGDITITVAAVEMAKLTPGSGFLYDVQMLNSSGVVSTLAAGGCVISKDITGVSS